MSEKPLLTRNQAAKKLGVRPQQLTKWLQAGRIPGARLVYTSGYGVWQIPADVQKPPRIAPGRKPNVH